jgi:hypothetical protein
MLLYMVFSTRCGSYNPEELARSLVQCVCKFISESDINLHTVHKTVHRLLGITAATPSAEHHVQ